MPNFYEASQRHYADAVLLQNSNRLPNAGQLYGLSAECGVKALMIAVLGTKLPEKYRKHPDKLVNLIPIFLTAVSGRQGIHYFTAVQQKFKAFGGCSPWDVDDRYESDTANISKWNSRSADWIEAARTVQQKLEQVHIDGVL
jgi:hypothetical protein